MSLCFEGKDDDGDPYNIEAFASKYESQPKVYLELELQSGDSFVLHGYTPRKARKLAKRLLKAADFAEGLV